MEDLIKQPEKMGPNWPLWWLLKSEDGTSGFDQILCKM